MRHCTLFRTDRVIKDLVQKRWYSKPFFVSFALFVARIRVVFVMSDRSCRGARSGWRFRLGLWLGLWRGLRRLDGGRVAGRILEGLLQRLALLE